MFIYKYITTIFFKKCRKNAGRDAGKIQIKQRNPVVWTTCKERSCFFSKTQEPANLQTILDKTKFYGMYFLNICINCFLGVDPFPGLSPDKREYSYNPVLKAGPGGQFLYKTTNLRSIYRGFSQVLRNGH